MATDEQQQDTRPIVTEAADDAPVSIEPPEWVKDPAKAYAEIRRTREEARTLREERAALETRRRKAETEAEALRTQVQAAMAEALRVRVAAEAGLPTALAGRLMGQTEDDLLADAEGLKALLITAPEARRAGPQGTTPAPRGSAQGETDDQRRGRLFGRGTGNPIFDRHHRG